MVQPDGTTTATAWQTSGTVVQDHTYRYDPAGNLLTIGDRTPASGLPAGVDPIHSLDKNTLNRVFGYDALNRLLTATGRETDTVPDQPWDDNPRGLDVTKARAYTETYTYDAVGNLTAVDHDTNTAGISAYTRTYTLASGSNQLSSMSVSGNLAGTYAYDAAGSLTEETTTRQFEWDYANRLATFRVQIGDATPSKYAQYRYDTTGERAIKVVRTGAAQDEITIYVGGFERSLVGSITGQLTSYDEIHLTDNDTRLAIIQRGAPHPADGITGQPVRYQIADHLASVIVTLDPAGIVLNTEEYLPYGETSFGSYQRKRYRYTGRERDAETGYAYHGARYYAPWLCRWSSADPAGHVEGFNLYAYASSSPLSRSDPRGRQSQQNSPGQEGPGWWRVKDRGAGDRPAVIEIHLSGTPTDESPSPGASNLHAPPQPGTNADGSTDWGWVLRQTYSQIDLTTTHEKRVADINAVLARNAPALKAAGLPTDNAESMLAGWGGLGWSLGAWLGGKVLGAVFKAIFVPRPVPGVSSVKLTAPNAGRYIPRYPGDHPVPELRGQVRPLPTLKQSRGTDVPLPDPQAEGRPHTILGGRYGTRGEGLYRQSATFTEDGNALTNLHGLPVPTGMVDWTTHNNPVEDTPGGTVWHSDPHVHGYFMERGNLVRGDPRGFTW